MLIGKFDTKGTQFSQLVSSAAVLLFRSHLCGLTQLCILDGTTLRSGTFGLRYSHFVLNFARH